MLEEICWGVIKWKTLLEYKFHSIIFVPSVEVFPIKIFFSIFLCRMLAELLLEILATRKLLMTKGTWRLPVPQHVTRWGIIHI